VSSAPVPHSEAVAAFLRGFGLIAFATADHRVGVDKEAMAALFGQIEAVANFPKVPKLARLQCIADNVDWDWTHSDSDYQYLEATYHTVFTVEKA